MNHEQKEPISERDCPSLERKIWGGKNVCYGDLHPKVIWGRTKTLGKGGNCCDFRMKVIQ
ncbi:MAG: L-2-amino-thiazoline-4-carboxylic acid hydrolase [Bacteroidales bacterium]|nr:L-2-amino-thiazoline-4-carboxylic acid hydrolase [Bacteroidales bacterium]